MGSKFPASNSTGPEGAIEAIRTVFGLLEGVCAVRFGDGIAPHSVSDRDYISARIARLSKICARLSPSYTARESLFPSIIMHYLA